MQQMIRSFGVLTAGLAVLTALGCSAPAPTGAPAAGVPAASTGPKVQRLGLGLNPPATESNRPSLVVSTNAYPGMPMWEDLFGVSPEGKELVPQLAKAWTLDADGTSYRVQLQKGVQFHNTMGEFTADDVVFSFNDMKTETEPVAPAVPRTLNIIKSFEVVNPYELIVHMNQPDAGLLTSISQAENIVPMRSKKDGEARGHLVTMQEQPVAGTGPYTSTDHQQGQYWRFKRVENHWRQTPDFPEFEWRFIKENSTIFAALLAHEIQVAALPPDMVPGAEQKGFKTIQGKAPGLHVYGTIRGVYLNKKIQPANQTNPDASQKYVYPNSPLVDLRVRKALNKAINRDSLNKAFLRGGGEPLYNEFFHANRPGWNPDWEKTFKDAYGYDPEAAKKLLAEAGFGPTNKPKVSMVLRPYPYFPGLFDMEEAIASDMRAVGFDVPLEQIDSATITKRDQSLDFQSAIYGIVTSVRPLAGVATYFSAIQGVGGRLGYESDEMDAIYANLRRTLDPAKAAELWRQWGDLAYTQYASIPLFWMPSEAVVDPAVVADYPFPGTISGTYTHVEYIKAK